MFEIMRSLVSCADLIDSRQGSLFMKRRSLHHSSLDFTTHCKLLSHMFTLHIKLPITKTRFSRLLLRTVLPSLNTNLYQGLASTLHAYPFLCPSVYIKVKVKLFLYLFLPEHHAMKACWGVEV